MGEDARPSPVILLEGADARWGELASQVSALGFVPLRCPNIESAELALEHTDQSVRCALIPTALADRKLKRALKGLRKAGARTGLHWIAVGPEPERGTRRLLKSAGIRYALWEPIEFSTLRFQLNRLTRANPSDEIRRARRAPTRLPARAYAGARGRDAMVYSLSESGAFLETPRACMSGATVDVELLLPDRTVSLQGTVAFANVPGNLQRPNLPLGMGVRFTAPSAADRNTLIGYVENRLAQLAV